jgi:hypothetical protein
MYLCKEKEKPPVLPIYINKCPDNFFQQYSYLVTALLRAARLGSIPGTG